ncbi:BON1-associated protein 2-like [Salvia divinorum]|uniref:BON1-associated protein 2-like n=1 Tax=Salvia divinorum TaxID=28513 RepID=A0ABD1H4F7_SALDI
MKDKTPPSQPIEVTVISGEGLLINRKPPTKNTVSVTVKTGPFLSCSTGVDPDGRSFPSWNERIVIDLPEQARFITVEARSGTGLIGSAAIPLTDFCGGCLPDGYLSFVSYRLRDATGEKNGILNLSIRVKGGGQSSGCAASFSKPSMGVPGAEAKPCAGVVTGIPVSYPY